MKNKIFKYEKSRQRMVMEQLIPRGITDQRVLDAMAMIPRHIFVEDALAPQAYGDFALPIGEGQTISQPYIVALMTQALEITGDETILEIGTGCGYQTAILAELCRQVYTIERLKPLHIQARKNFDQLGYYNITYKIDDGTVGWPEQQPFAGIIVTAAGPHIPDALIDQLATPGIMVIPVGDRISQDLVVLKKTTNQIEKTVIEKVRFVSLIGSQGWVG